MICTVRNHYGGIEILTKYPEIPAVLGPSLISKSGAILLEESTIELLSLWALSKSIGNHAESFQKCRINPALPFNQTRDRISCWKTAILDDFWVLPTASSPKAVVIKGGHSTGNESNDYVLISHFQETINFWLKAQRVDTKNSPRYGLHVFICGSSIFSRAVKH